MLDPFLILAGILNNLAKWLIIAIKLAFLAVFVKLMADSLLTEWWIWMS